ncbi:MAG: hypothetical protein K0Q90_4049 [Paenibacillaceae bacterium]|nr:hypothetical protein [Paenibacillaceae bacterium]
MKSKWANIKFAVFGLVFILGLVFAEAPHSQTAPALQNAPVPQTEGKSKHELPRNNDGKAYGSLSDAKSFEDAPDLISAQGIDGTGGYIKFTDAFEEAPRNPEEAIERQKNRIPGSRLIPLYDQDGVTVIGQFRATGSETQ